MLSKIWQEMTDHSNWSFIWIKQPTGKEGMPMHTLNIGHGASIITDKVFSILQVSSTPIKAIKEKTKDGDQFIDAIYGKPTRSLLIMSEGLVIGANRDAHAIMHFSCFASNSIPGFAKTCRF